MTPTWNGRFHSWGHSETLFLLAAKHGHRASQGPCEPCSPVWSFPGVHLPFSLSPKPGSTEVTQPGAHFLRLPSQLSTEDMGEGTSPAVTELDNEEP
jgi:hypothetical protein